MPTKVTVFIKQTIQLRQYEPLTVELGVEKEVISDDPETISKEHRKLSKEIHETVTDILTSIMNKPLPSAVNKPIPRRK